MLVELTDIPVGLTNFKVESAYEYFDNLISVNNPQYIPAILLSENLHFSHNAIAGIRFPGIQGGDFYTSILCQKRTKIVTILPVSSYGRYIVVVSMLVEGEKLQIPRLYVPWAFVKNAVIGNFSYNAHLPSIVTCL